jgi:transcriptional regulator with XRE-family HTH domain
VPYAEVALRTTLRRSSPIHRHCPQSHCVAPGLVLGSRDMLNCVARLDVLKLARPGNRAVAALSSIRYTCSEPTGMERSNMPEQHGLLERARRLSGLSRSELARRAGASRPTLAAYASGAKSPNLSTAERIVQAAGFDLDLVPRPIFREAAGRHGRAIYVPAVFPRQPVDRALATVRLPLHLDWSQPDREYDLSNRRQRARVYEIVLREGTGEDIMRYIDGALLVDLWPDLVLPTEVRREWQPLIDSVHG